VAGPPKWGEHHGLCGQCPERVDRIVNQTDIELRQRGRREPAVGLGQMHGHALTGK